MTSVVSALHQTVILANGEFPRHEIPARLLKEARQIICCDGAVNQLVNAGYTPSVIVGDLDSITTENRNKFEKIIRQDASKEYNDLTKALLYCRNSKLKAASILGASGFRDDHFLGNIGVMMMFAGEQGMELQMVTNYGIFTPAFQTIELNSFPGQQISVFSFSPKCELTFYGLRYPVTRKTFIHLWEGSLNEATDDRFRIECSSKGSILIYRAFA